MKFSKETLNILKNFSNINSNLMLLPGNTLATISAQKNVLAEVTIPETIPVDFGIYDLSEFLGSISFFEDPDIEFTQKSALISENGHSINYKPSDSSVLALPPKNKIKFPSPEVEFDLPGEQLTKVIRIASVLKSTDVSVIGKNGELVISVSDIKNALANSYTYVVGKTDLVFQANIKVDNLKMIPQDYHVSISSKKISRWVANNNDMTVFVAIETTSTF